MRGDQGGTARDGRRPTVLHVAEAWGGGVQTAVRDYVRSVPEVRHLLLMSERADCQITDADALFDGVWRMPSGHFARVRDVGRLFRRLRPDVVHAHSSLAGAYVRLAPSVPTERIVYTPHCYAMERGDLARHAAAAVQAVERVLSRRTGTVAGVSPVRSNSPAPCASASGPSTYPTWCPVRKPPPSRRGRGQSPRCAPGTSAACRRGQSPPSAGCARRRIPPSSRKRLPKGDG